MGAGLTKLENLIDPEVMADMISAKLPKKIAVAPFAKIDESLQGVPGDTITVPKYGYIGDAEDVAEGETCSVSQMSATTTRATIKKAMKAVSITDEAQLSAYGDPVGQATNQLSLAMASKVDNDCMDALQGASLIYDGSARQISYEGIVDAIGKMEEEFVTEKAMFIHPLQRTTLLKDPNFISADKYPENVTMSGEIGKIANCRVIASKKVPTVQVGTTTKVDCYSCPIVKLTRDDETEDETAALTIYLKRDTAVDSDRTILSTSTTIAANRFYAAVLSDESKVVLARFKK